MDEDCCKTESSETEPEPKKCCKKKDKDGQELNTGLSQILLGVVKNDKEIARHQKRFGISSFIYRSRRPFHPGRLHDAFLNKYFSFHGSLKAEKEETDNLGLENRQKELASKGEERSKIMGGLMRSKARMNILQFSILTMHTKIWSFKFSVQWEKFLQSIHPCHPCLGVCLGRHVTVLHGRVAAGGQRSARQAGAALALRDQAHVGGLSLRARDHEGDDGREWQGQSIKYVSG